MIKNINKQISQFPHSNVRSHEVLIQVIGEQATTKKHLITGLLCNLKHNPCTLVYCIVCIFSSKLLECIIVTPHAQREQVISVCAHRDVFVDKKNFKSYFSNQLTFSKIRGRTSRRIYRLAMYTTACSRNTFFTE